MNNICIDYISWSWLNTYVNCKRQFYYKYILKIPYIDEKQDYFEYGINIWNYIQNKVSWEWKVDYKRLTESNYYELFIDHISKLDWIINQIREDKNIQVESKFSIPYQIWEKKINLLWFFDIETDKNIIEIKTKSWNRTKKNIAESRQFRLYNFIAKLKNKSLWLISCNKNNWKVIFQKIERWDLMFEKDLNNILENINIDIKNYDKPYRPFCKFCPYYKIMCKN